MLFLENYILVEKKKNLGGIGRFFYFLLANIFAFLRVAAHRQKKKKFRNVITFIPLKKTLV